MNECPTKPTHSYVASIPPFPWTVTSSASSLFVTVWVHHRNPLGIFLLFWIKEKVLHENNLVYHEPFLFQVLSHFVGLQLLFSWIGKQYQIIKKRKKDKGWFMTGKIDDDEVLFWHISQSERRFGLQYSLLLIILEHKVNQYLLPDFQMNSDFPSEKKASHGRTLQHFKNTGISKKLMDVHIHVFWNSKHNHEC